MTSLAPPIVLDLVERFRRNADAYRSGAYNETELRREFLDPFFKALGWDIDNEKGHAEAYKDVIHEGSIKIEEAVKTPDYSFRIGGTRKFFLEAKKPSISIKDDSAAAYQLRRYAWSAKLPLSILSDFEEFAVYDCRIKPDKDDPASRARLLYIDYQDYSAQWVTIFDIFSPAAVLKGSFDKYAETIKGKKGTTTVDNAFLTEIESWRDELAHNLALRNATLTQRELNFAVQCIIDRLIFLRICEDRSIEEYGTLLNLVSGEQIYARLFQFFQRADERYNSGLFHFKREKNRHEAPDQLTPTLDIDDKLLRKIVRSVYYPESPYEFSVLPADILGQVYEQFLGKVIRLTPGHHAVVEDKPEVKKSGGVYYTPTYIVKYIVQNTLGKLLEGKTPKQIAQLRVLDPACGSGSFLLGAYQYLLEWHRDRYVEMIAAPNAPSRTIAERNASKPPIFESADGAWRLTTAERKRILLNNIYGVDIDAQAVETTKLSLLLKVLEGESQQTLEKQLKMFRERALPDLGDNIKCGNSVIGADFYQGRQLPLLNEEERYRINVFDWQAEFPNIFRAGGFDVAIGNPPYIFTREQISEVARNYFSEHYQLSWEKHNTFMLFMELLLRLVKNTGYGGYIVPNSWLTIESGHLLRQVYIKRLDLIADLNYAAFHGVSMEPCIFVMAGQDIKRDVETIRAQSRDEFIVATPVTLKRAAWSGAGNRIILASSVGVAEVLDKILRNSCSLESQFEVKTGLQAYERGKGTPSQTERDVREHVFDSNKRQGKDSVRYLEGHDVGRYKLSWSGKWMRYGPWLAQPRDIAMFTRPRILLREITAPLPYCLFATLSTEIYLNNKSILNVLHPHDLIDKLKALTCVLNSRLLSIFYKNHAVKGARTIFPKVVIKNLREFPFPRTLNQNVLQALAALADTESLLYQRLSATNTLSEKTSLKRQIAAADGQVDRLVYDLYDLTAKDIAMVEEAR